MEKWKAKEVKHPKSTSQVRCECVMYFITGVVELQSFQLCNRAVVTCGGCGRVGAVVLRWQRLQHHTQSRGNKLIKDILDTCTLQD